MKLTGIYLITNLINGKPYVGLSENIPVRWSKHYRNKKTGCKALSNAFNKYGVDNFNFKIIHQCSKTRLKELEKFYIKKLNSLYPNGYNLTKGGENPEWSDVSRERARQASLEAHKKPRKKFVRTQKPTPESIAKQIESQNKAVCQYTKDNVFVKEWKSVKEASDSLKIANGCISKVCSGKRKSTGGFIWKYKDHIPRSHNITQEFIDNKKIKNKERYAKKVVQMNLDGTVVKIWDSGADATRSLGFSAGTISNVCLNKGGRTMAGGFKWKYVENKNVV